MHSSRSPWRKSFSALVIPRRQREGFYPLRAYEAGYPKAEGWAEHEAAAFLASLDLVEARVHHSGKLCHRGRDLCRHCGQPAGSRELIYRGWSWTGGLRHYIEVHRVRPGDEFIRFIEAAAAELREHWRNGPVVHAAPAAADAPHAG